MEQAKENILVPISSSVVGESFGWLLRTQAECLFPKTELRWSGGEMEAYRYKNQVSELLRDILPSSYVGGPGIEYPWWMFADEENGTQYEKNFSILMKRAGITGEYEGYCRVTDWDQFLDHFLSVLLNVGGTDPLFMFDISSELMFYMHYSGGLGFVYRRNKPQVLVDIVRKAIEMGYTTLESTFEA